MDKDFLLKNSLVKEVSIDYELDKFLGQGSYGRVFKAKRRTDNLQVAIKFCKKESRSNTTLSLIRKEYEMLRNIKHPNILKTYGFYENFETIAIVLEYCEGGDLSRFIRYRKSTQNQPDLELEVRSILKGILLGLNYIHNIWDSLHRDIKPRS